MVLTGHTGQVSLGHAAFLAFGCYANVVLIEAGVPFLIAFPLAGILTGIAGVTVAIPALRLHGIYLAIFTMALSILMDDIIVLSEPITGGVAGKYVGGVEIFGHLVDRWGTPDLFFWLVLTVAVLVTLGYINLLRTPLGRSFIAARDSEVSAQAMGVDIARTKMISFALSCAVTGWAGALDGAVCRSVQQRNFQRTDLDPIADDDRDRRAGFDPWGVSGRYRDRVPAAISVNLKGICRCPFRREYSGYSGVGIRHLWDDPDRFHPV